MVNAADNKQRDPSMTTIKVTIDRAAGSITVWNDGKGIPVEMHSEHKCYVPELIFGHLLTGSNFDDDEKKTTGGRATAAPARESCVFLASARDRRRIRSARARETRDSQKQATATARSSRTSSAVCSWWRRRTLCRDAS